MHVKHPMSSPCGAFLFIQRNDIRDTFTQLLSELCPCVGIEPTLLSSTGEKLQYIASKIDDDAQVDIIARGFWDCKEQDLFFNIRVFNRPTLSNCKESIASCYRIHKQEKTE